ncbi:TRAP-type C4-dicarboxylate transport system, small permease component [Mesorhizobium australicum]|uniref:TRAP transporter small permease protein n=2 Tax=Mesorhizobium australicum TaxID=536018 RepID=A0A1X7NFB6_9HYPH|nr:TRAP-type C4-dicarboxylate transport system, small permease component [Mesorhizobium australicum]
MRKLGNLISYAASALMLSLMVLTVLDVIGRNVFGHPLRGATELTEIALVVLTFLLFPFLALRSQHIVADVADSFGSRILDVLQILLTAVLGALLFALITWRLWILAGRSTAYGDVTSSFGFQIGPILYFTAVLAALSALAFLPPLLKFIRRPAEAEPTHQQSIL